MIKATVFDMDGLLLDTEIVSLKMYQELLKQHGITTFTSDIYAENYSGHNAIDNMTNLIDTYQLPITVEEGLAITDVIESELLTTGVNIKPGANDLLAYLKAHNYHIGLATSSTRDRAIMVLEQNNILQYFEEMTFNAEVAHGKPAPDIFTKAMEKLSVSPEETVIFEDSEAGIMAGVASGAQVICIPDMHTPNGELLDKTAATYPDLGQAITFFE